MTSPLLTTYPAQTAHLVRRVERGRGRDRLLALVELRTVADGWAAWRIGVRALARELGEDPAAVSRALASLVEDGLVWRKGGVLSLDPGPHQAELVRDDDPPKARAEQLPRPSKALAVLPVQGCTAAHSKPASLVFDDELRAILGRQDLDPATLAELEAQDLAAITAPRPPRSPSHARQPAPHQALEVHQAQEAPRPPLAPEPPRPPDVARRVSGVADAADGREPQEVAQAEPKPSPARAAWVRFFGAPRRPEDRPWEGLHSMTQGQILTVILLLLEVRAREGRLRNLALMSRDKGEAVARGEFVVREWTMHELERADKGASLADLLAARLEDDSSNTPLADDLLAALPPAPPPATPDQRRAALAAIRAMLSDHLPQDLDDRKEITP